MPQIGVYNPGQRLEPSSPVAVGSSENARAMGEAASGFGGELFKLGNILDQAGKRLKEEEDRLSVTRAANAFRLEMLRERAIQEASGIQEDDDASGISGIDRFTAKLTPISDRIAETLKTPKQREMFMAAIGDDIVKDATTVLATEVSKREKNLDVMLQGNISDKASIAREDWQTSGRLMQEAEVEIYASSYLPDAKKIELTQKAKKQIAGEALNGILERGANGDQKQWTIAENALTQNFKDLFTTEEMDKQWSAIQKAKNDYYTLDWQAYTQTERKNEDIRRVKETKALQEYTAAKAAAKNDQYEVDAINKRIEMDPRLSPEKKKAMIENRTFMEVSDDEYEGKLFTEVFRTQRPDKALTKVNIDYTAGKVSTDRYTKIVKALENMKEQKGKDPTLTKVVTEFTQEIASYSKSSIIMDPATGLYRAENDQYNAKVQSDFAMRVSRLYSEGRYTADNIKAAFLTTMQNSTYGGRSVKQDVRGVNPEHLTTTKGTQGVIDNLYKDYKTNGKNWSPEKKKEVEQQLRGLRENKLNNQIKDSIKVSPIMQQNNSKVFDE